MSVVVLLWAVMDPSNLCPEEGSVWGKRGKLVFVSYWFLFLWFCLVCWIIWVDIKGV